MEGRLTSATSNPSQLTEHDFLAAREGGTWDSAVIMGAENGMFEKYIIEYR